MTTFPSLLLARIDTVFHVGSLELSERSDRTSLEGNLLSVSEHPEEWSRIAHCGGETWCLEREGAAWLDAFALSQEEIAAVTDWAIGEGLARHGEIWRAWSYDCETEDWRVLQFDCEEDAQAEIEDEEPEEDVPSLTGELVDRIEGPILTEAGMEAVGRWHDPLTAIDALVMIWADRILKKENPDLMGVWWFEKEAPELHICPRGGAFPDRLGEFTVTNARGEPAPESFRERHGAEPAETTAEPSF